MNENESKTCIFFHFGNDSVVQFLLNVRISGQLKTSVCQSGGRRVETGQQKKCRLKYMEGNIFCYLVAYTVDPICLFHTWPIKISSISSGVHMGTVLPSTSSVNSRIDSPAISIKS